MTAFADARTVMRAQTAAQIQGNGVLCDILRLSPTADATGRKTGSYASLVPSGGVDEMIWIQPIAGTSDIQSEGISAETTHYAYQSWSGRELLPKDRILQSGGTYVYDVIRPQVFETHRRAEVKQVRRF